MNTYVQPRAHTTMLHVNTRNRIRNKKERKK
uniref:Uncharacterized protein n=1 Tax=Rhizophora mucronata TaxID=61149 RepID=A0A2P2P4W2_RHIMU